jgi:hypothetical protein
MGILKSVYKMDRTRKYAGRLCPSYFSSGVERDQPPRAIKSELAGSPFPTQRWIFPLRFRKKVTRDCLDKSEKGTAIGASRRFGDTGQSPLQLAIQDRELADQVYKLQVNWGTSPVGAQPADKTICIVTNRSKGSDKRLSVLWRKDPIYSIKACPSAGTIQQFLAGLDVEVLGKIGREAGDLLQSPLHVTGTDVTATIQLIVVSEYVGGDTTAETERWFFKTDCVLDLSPRVLG